VDLALRQCGLVADGGRVTVHIENDDVVDALARRADGARLLILGASTPGGHRRAGFAPVSQVCRPHVSCPVVIVDIHDEADTRPA
jgi:hypothetical protein